MSGMLARGLVVACWAATQIGYLSFVFGFSLVPQAITEQYANGPLPTTPGPPWLYLVFIASWLLMLVSSVGVLPTMLVSNTRYVRRLTPSGSRRRTACLIVCGVALVLEATIWAGLYATSVFSGLPAWPALGFAVMFGLVGVAMIRVLSAVQLTGPVRPFKAVRPGD